MTLDNTDITAPHFQLVPAGEFTIEELTLAYNQGRADYLVPMPMREDQFEKYIHNYSVDLNRSLVALENGSAFEDGLLGLGMLGMRPGRAWVTRLTVLPAARRKHVGLALVRALLSEARSAGLPLAILEYIQGNQQAGGLFDQVGFVATRSLLVLRRPAGARAALPAGQPRWLDSAAALGLLERYPDRLPWTNEPETYRLAGDARGLVVELGSGGAGAAARGWLVFRRQPNMLSHFVMHTESGSPSEIGAALLGHLYMRYPRIESYVENVPAGDPHISEFARQGFAVSFRRTEMHLKLK